MARRLSVVAEEDGHGDARPQLAGTRLDGSGSGSWQNLPPETKGEIQELAYPQRKSCTTVASTPASAPTNATTTNAFAESIGIGNEKTDAENVSTAQPRQLRGGPFYRSSSKDSSAFRLSSQGSSNTSASSISSSSASSTNPATRRATFGFRQQRPEARPPVKPGFLYPAGVSIDMRRNLEVSLLRTHEKLTINSHIGEYWMIIDASWVNSWVLFAMGGTSPPGPISNRYLYLEPGGHDGSVGSANFAGTSASFKASMNSIGLTGSGLKQSLKIAKHYRAMHPLAWYILEEIYGTDGTPDICRWQPDIYSYPVPVARRARAARENQTRANQEFTRAICIARNKVAAEVDRLEQR